MSASTAMSAGNSASKIILNFVAIDATLIRENADLVFVLPNGQREVVANFFEAYQKAETLPTFEVDGKEVEAKDLFASMQAENLLPGAGPAQANSLYHNYENLEFADGIDHLWGLGYASDRAGAPDASPLEGILIASADNIANDAGADPSISPQASPFAPPSYQPSISCPATHPILPEPPINIPASKPVPPVTNHPTNELLPPVGFNPDHEPEAVPPMVNNIAVSEEGIKAGDSILLEYPRYEITEVISNGEKGLLEKTTDGA